MDLIDIPTQQQIADADHNELLYRGKPYHGFVYEPLAYGVELMNQHFGEGNYTGQEVYLGYSPTNDRFYMAVEGSERVEDEEDPMHSDWGDMESSVFVIHVTEDNKLEWKLLQHYPTNFYDHKAGETMPYKLLRAAIPDMLDVRLD